MTKILWFGDGSDSGFGTVTRNIGKRLLRDGYDVRFILQNRAWAPSASEIDLAACGASYICDIDKLPNDDLALILSSGFPDGWKPDAVVLLADYGQATMLAAGRGTKVADAFNANNVLHYIPIEGTGLPPDWKRWFSAVRAVAMTDFGAGELKKLLGYAPPVIYHGVDRNVFYPVSRECPIILDDALITSKAEARRYIGLNPSNVMLLKADRYMPRKNWNAVIRSLAPVLESRNDIDFVIHCLTNDQGGVLENELERLNPKAYDQLRLTRHHNSWRGLSEQKLAVMLNAADMYINAGAEGFGLLIAEALACGVPAVGVDYSAVPEIIGKAGLLYPIAHEIDNQYNHRWCTPNETALREAVLRLADNRKLREHYGALGPAQVAKFDWDVAAKQFGELCDAAKTMAVARASDPVRSDI